MTDSLNLYLVLESQLLKYRLSHPKESLEEEILLERMDDIWWRLTINEKEWLNKRNS